IVLGDNGVLGRTTIGARKRFEGGVVESGNHSTIGYGTVLRIAKKVSIGDHCLIGPHCMIMDSDNYPVNPELRRLRRPGDTVRDIEQNSGVQSETIRQRAM